jgi:hypothetical protein
MHRTAPLTPRSACAAAHAAFIHKMFVTQLGCWLLLASMPVCRASRRTRRCTAVCGIRFLRTHRASLLRTPCARDLSVGGMDLARFATRAAARCCSAPFAPRLAALRARLPACRAMDGSSARFAEVENQLATIRTAGHQRRWTRIIKGGTAPAAA